MLSLSRNSFWSRRECRPLGPSRIPFARTYPSGGRDRRGLISPIFSLACRASPALNCLPSELRFASADLLLFVRGLLWLPAVYAGRRSLTAVIRGLPSFLPRLEHLPLIRPRILIRSSHLFRPLPYIPPPFSRIFLLNPYFQFPNR